MCANLVIADEHISRRTGRPTGRPHVHRDGQIHGRLVSVGGRVPVAGEHISRHTGRPTGRPHVHRGAASFPGEHISRHTGRPTGRPHIHHDRVSVIHLSSGSPSRRSAPAALISIGIVIAIAGIAAIALGAVYKNNIAVGIGTAITAGGLLMCAFGIAIAGKNRKTESNENEQAPASIDPTAATPQASPSEYSQDDAGFSATNDYPASSIDSVE